MSEGIKKNNLFFVIGGVLTVVGIILIFLAFSGIGNIHMGWSGNTEYNAATVGFVLIILGVLSAVYSFYSMFQGVETSAIDRRKTPEEKLEELKSLREKGLINEEQFEKRRENILNQHY